MNEHPLWRTVALLAAGISVITGAATIIGWMASESLADTLAITVNVAGYLYILVVAGFAAAFSPVRGWRDEKVLRVVVFIVAASLYAFMSSKELRLEPYWPSSRWPSGQSLLRVFGVFGLVGGAIAAVAWGPAWVSELQAAHRDAYKACPECCEKVRSEARVCRYCNYRFSPPPSASVRANGGQDPGAEAQKPRV